MVDAKDSPSSEQNANEAPDSPIAVKKSVSNNEKITIIPRLDLDGPLQKLHHLLKDKWSTYQQIVTDFITGRLTRVEFEQQLNPMMIKGFARLHNEIMMSFLANSFREAPPLTASNSFGWSKKRRDPPRTSGDKSAKRLKLEVMSLPNRERLRIKAIPKEPPRRMTPSCMIETRFAKLPRVPLASQKINTSQHQNDILKGFHVPLASEAMEMPEPETLKDRITAIALEHGLLGGVQANVTEMVIQGLDIHLRNILTATLTKLRTNRTEGIQIVKEQPEAERRGSATNKQDDVTELVPHEIAMAYRIAPHTFTENPPSIMRLLATTMRDSDTEPTWENIEDTTPESGMERLRTCQFLDGILS